MRALQLVSDREIPMVIARIDCFSPGSVTDYHIYIWHT